MSAPTDAVETLTPTLLGRSLLFSLGMIAATGVVALALVLNFAQPFSRRYRISRYWSRFNLWWLWVTCRIDYQISGAEHLPDRPVIIMAKHQSTWETMFLHQYLPPVAWVIKRELLWLPFFGWGLALLRPIAINRRAGASAMKQVIRQGVKHLRQGQWVLIFPQGTRVAPGVRQRYGMGGAVLATHTGCPILPVALNAGEFWPRGGFLKRPGTIQVAFGPLIESEGRSAQELNQQVEEWIETTMTRINAVAPQAR
ncbi:MAG: 1-acyl-sn-glycerol-3-phosphate acyltransferase [Candidatus Contendobacter sp.]|jgi:1-acyl-sn-glycerol-3-phosphate acyltransferase|nr:1-acyl-sn-glycerol-3-phosphate acyltransferase [Gammaproteobacteria bacterium]MCC8995381.1 1-acyl-sn-glycerol-3-phosphate acyltransferase [Candidatus Contendobacter sp.]